VNVRCFCFRDTAAARRDLFHRGRLPASTTLNLGSNDCGPVRGSDCWPRAWRRRRWAARRAMIMQGLLNWSVPMRTPAWSRVPRPGDPGDGLRPHPSVGALAGARPSFRHNTVRGGSPVRLTSNRELRARTPTSDHPLFFAGPFAVLLVCLRGRADLLTVAVPKQVEHLAQ